MAIVTAFSASKEDFDQWEGWILHMEPNKNRPMRRFFFACTVMLSAMVLFSSCLGDDDDDETVYPDDAAITSFTLGTLKQYCTKKDRNGNDSTYVVAVTGSNYKMYIDQVNRLIYNPDSLPYGTDAAHVVCNVTSKNSGTILLKSMTSDSVAWYNSSDSIDFTQPRNMIVFSANGKHRTDYTVQLNVRKEVPDSFVWHQSYSLDAFADAKGLKAVHFNDRIFAFVSDGDNGMIFSTDEDDIDWQMVPWNLESPIPAKAYENVVVMGDQMYMYAYNLILRTTDGVEWEKSANADIEQLVAASRSVLYARSHDGNLLASADGGATWKRETLDSDASLLPTSEISYCLVPSRVNKSVESILLIGNRSVAEYDTDTQAYVWSKVFDPDNDMPWMYVSYFDMPSLALPRLASLTAVPYADGIIAVGGQGVGACEVPAFQQIYYSADGGIYWRENKKFYLPEEMISNDTFTMTAGCDDSLWIICGGSGQVWKGRLSGGSPVKKAFTE